MDLLVLTKNANVGYSVDLMIFITVLSVLFGIVIIVAKNPIHSILFLIGLFIVISAYLILTGLVFIGLSYLLIYVGAISILFLFIMMLINIRVSELVTEGRNSLILALFSILTFNYSINDIVSGNFFFDKSEGINSNYYYTGQSNYGDNLSFNEIWVNSAINQVATVNIKVWETVLNQISHISTVGNILYTNLFVYLMLISLILLLAMVGAIIIIKS